METPKSKVRKVFNTIGSFFQKSYSVIIGIGTLITSIATIYLMSIQNNLQLKSNEIQRVANLPHFSVKYYTSDLNSDEIPETEYIEISNIGKPTYSPTSVTLNFFYDVRNKNGETRRIPITGYYNLRFVTDALEGRIFKASNPYNFQDYISTERTSNFYVQKMTLVRIDYTDIYVTRHSLFYKENRVISEQEYNDIINSAIEQSYKHDEITEQDLIALF